MNNNLKQAIKRFGEATEAISPVVATLLLVLVAAGAAIGFGVFLNGFQKDTQENVSTDAGGQVLRIDGSSTVYELTTRALPAFEAQYPMYDVQTTHDGSGVGRQAAGTCLTDIGTSSSPFLTTETAKWPDCNGDGKKDAGRELVIVKVATDAVVPVFLSTNTHCTGTLSLTKDNLREIYAKNVVSLGGSLDTTKFGSIPNGLTVDANTPVTWENLDPDTDNGGANAGNQCTGTNPIVVFDRSDKGGTSEIAAKSLLGGSQSQLEDIGITLPSSLQGDGNQGVLSAVNAHANKDHALFFTSFGYANENSLKLTAFGKSNAPILPTTANIKTETFEATRPILYATVGSASSVSDILNPAAKLWMEFMLSPNNNIKFAGEAFFVSLYA